MTVDDYRRTHGLPSSIGLVPANTHATYATRARQRCHRTNQAVRPQSQHPRTAVTTSPHLGFLLDEIDPSVGLTQLRCFFTIVFAGGLDAVVTVGDLQPAMQAGLGRSRSLSQSDAAAPRLAVHRDDITTKLLGKHIWHEKHPSTV